MGHDVMRLLGLFAEAYAGFGRRTKPDDFSANDSAGKIPRTFSLASANHEKLRPCAAYNGMPDQFVTPWRRPDSGASLLPVTATIHQEGVMNLPVI
jgi:hypothetical protein